MNENPALFIQFDPETWKITSVLFKSRSDEETKRLTAIITSGVKCELAPKEGRYDA